MGTALLALCFCALSLVLALFVGISPISDKAKIRFMYVGAALSLMAVPMMSHYIAGLNNIVDELRYQAVLVFIVVACCYCFVMANMVKWRCLRTRWRNSSRSVLLQCHKPWMKISSTKCKKHSTGLQRR